MNIDEITASLDKQNKVDAQEKKEAQQLQQILDSQTELKATVQSAIQSLINFQANHEPNVSVKNQKLPTTIKTPDVQAVVDALKSLEKTTDDTKPDNSELLKALSDLKAAIVELPAKIDIPEAPEPVEEVTVKNQLDYKPDLKAIRDAVGKIDVKPAVTVTQEKTIIDLKQVTDSLDKVVSAVGNIPKPEKVDLAGVVTATKAVQDAIQSLRFPVPNYVLPFSTKTGKATQVVLNDDGTLPIPASGGGTQYADGAARGTATGTLGMVDDGVNIQSMLGDTSGRPFLGSETLIKRTITANTSGDTTLYTPASGKAIRLHFFGLSAGSNVTGCLAQTKLAGYNSGSTFDAQYLITAGQAYARNIQAGKRYIQGSADGALTITLSASQTVYCNFEIEEVS